MKWKRLIKPLAGFSILLIITLWGLSAVFGPEPGVLADFALMFTSVGGLFWISHDLSSTIGGHNFIPQWEEVSCGSSLKQHTYQISNRSAGNSLPPSQGKTSKQLDQFFLKIREGITAATRIEFDKRKLGLRQTYAARTLFSSCIACNSEFRGSKLVALATPNAIWG